MNDITLPAALLRPTDAPEPPPGHRWTGRVFFEYAPDVTEPPEPPQPKPVTEFEARRLMKQGGILGTDEEVAAAMAMGRTAWVDWQLGLPLANNMGTHMRDGATQAQVAAYGLPTSKSHAGNRHTEVFFWQAIREPDVVRTRMYWALSQIFVWSNSDNPTEAPLTTRMDILHRNALGNFRQLLGEIVFSRTTADYLTYHRNRKGDASGRIPDENMAREVMQLFTIGTVQLGPSGYEKREPTYGPEHIAGLAKVFTGIAADTGAKDKLTNPNAWHAHNAGWQVVDGKHAPLIVYPQHHDTSEKTILPGVTLPALTLSADPVEAQAQCVAEINAALDALFEHFNTPAFISRALIQFFTTANPSEFYILRVAGAFFDNGQGVRGDLKAVVRAILLDPEAETFDERDEAGLVMEPILALCHQQRAMKYLPQDGTGYGQPGQFPRFQYWAGSRPNDRYGQWPFQSPSVFNHYSPNYRPPGELAERGLRSPVMQILTESTLTSIVNEGTRGMLNLTEPGSFKSLFEILAAVPGETAADVQAGRCEASIAFLERKFGFRVHPKVRPRLIEQLGKSITNIPAAPNTAFVSVLFGLLASLPDFRVLR